MSDAAPFPRDDRAWPRGAFTFSLACGIAALVGSAALVASADSLRQVVGVAVVFLVLAGLQAASYVRALRPWLRGRSVPRRTQAIQAVPGLLVLLAFVGGPQVGGAALCGLVAGVFLPNAWAIRLARINRDLVDDGEALLAQEHAAAGGGAPAPEPSLRAVPRVGPVLRETLTQDRGRWLAWAAATMMAVLGCTAAGATGSALLGVALVGAGALARVGRQVVGGWLALRDFEQAANPPRRAYVVLLHDPNPRMSRPLLGVWRDEPFPTGGRLPRAEAVYRCDDQRDALLSRQGGVVVHEAWVDTGPRARSLPRWVAADAGVVLPQRRATLGRWYLASVIGAERPAPTRPLTMRAPHPTTEQAETTYASVVNEAEPATGRWVGEIAWRLSALIAVAVAFAWLT